VFAEQQMGALRAAVIAAMPAGQVGPQAARLAALYSGRYGWHPEEVTREIIDAVDRYYQPDRETAVLPQPAATAVQQAIAPPRQRSASVHEGTEPRPMHSAQRQSRERASAGSRQPDGQAASRCRVAMSGVRNSQGT